MRRVMVRYRLLPERVAEHEALLAAVFAELATQRPAGLEYRVVLSARRPGVVALALSAVRVTNDAEVTKHLHVPVVDRIFAAFGAEATDLPRVLRLTAAFGALAVTTLALGHLPVHETRGEVIAICCATLATPTTPTTPS